MGGRAPNMGRGRARARFREDGFDHGVGRNYPGKNGQADVDFSSERENLNSRKRLTYENVLFQQENLQG